MKGRSLIRWYSLVVVVVCRESQKAIWGNLESWHLVYETIKNVCPLSVASRSSQLAQQQRCAPLSVLFDVEKPQATPAAPKRSLGTQRTASGVRKYHAGPWALFTFTQRH